MKFVEGKLYNSGQVMATDVLYGMDTGNRVMLQKVDKFCYVADLLDADEWYDSAPVAKIR